MTTDIISILLAFCAPIVMFFLMRNERHASRETKKLLAETETALIKANAALIKSQANHTNAQSDAMLDKIVDDASIAIITTLREQIEAMEVQIIEQSLKVTGLINSSETNAQEWRAERTAYRDAISEALQIINELFRGLKIQNTQLQQSESTPAWVMSPQLVERIENAKEWGKL